MKTEDIHVENEMNNERFEILKRLESWLETPMIVLGFIWLALLIAELRLGINPFLEMLGTVIWTIFILDFVVRLVIAPQKLSYLKSNWLTVVALIVPALRILRIIRVVRLLRVARATRGLRLLRLVTSLNRGMKAIGASFGRRGFGYILALTLIVNLTGAAGMYAFEREMPRGFDSYGAALWWTAMLLTTMGTEYWPQTAEGRVLCFLLSLYGFAVFGYVTAALASYFVGRDANNEDAELVSAKPLNELRHEITIVHEELRALRKNLAIQE
ncbi:MAG TPA: ion transporter [Pyrinomonadaceae bacterium]|nr:ion transporter [Pyrinomonadaceae bacterium]